MVFGILALLFSGNRITNFLAKNIILEEEFVKECPDKRLMALQFKKLN
jgi:hypothetical protein